MKVKTVPLAKILKYKNGTANRQFHKEQAKKKLPKSYIFSIYLQGNRSIEISFNIKERFVKKKLIEPQSMAKVEHEQFKLRHVGLRANLYKMQQMA